MQYTVTISPEKLPTEEQGDYLVSGESITVNRDGKDIEVKDGEKINEIFSMPLESAMAYIANQRVVFQRVDKDVLSKRQQLTAINKRIKEAQLQLDTLLQEQSELMERQAEVFAVAAKAARDLASTLDEAVLAREERAAALEAVKPKPSAKKKTPAKKKTSPEPKEEVQPEPSAESKEG